MVSGQTARSLEEDCHLPTRASALSAIPGPLYEVFLLPLVRY